MPLLPYKLQFIGLFKISTSLRGALARRGNPVTFLGTFLFSF